MSDAAYVWGTGRRKCAVAQVRLFAGEGGIVVNGKPYAELFPRLEHRRVIEGPLTATEMAGKFRVEGKTYEVQDGDVLHFLFSS